MVVQMNQNESETDKTGIDNDENKHFVSELRGKTLMSANGDILGIIDNFVVDTESGRIDYVLVAPTEDLDVTQFKIDKTGRVVLDFGNIKAVKDVVVIGPM